MLFETTFRRLESASSRKKNLLSQAQSPKRHKQVMHKIDYSNSICLILFQIYLNAHLNCEDPPLNK